MKPVKVYTKTYCPYCDRAKELLKKKNVSFEETNIENDPEGAQKLFAKTGFKTVPQIFIGEECIGGCDDLYALEKAGKLDALLA
ncbi:MAG: glutaredoxin 3 [Bacteriovoracaceae bacterium]|nr:glutaredoxin 3 [Bacteriovoracaceae bacterium]